MKGYGHVEHSHMELRDLLYFDFDKAASLFSQIEGGLVEKVESGSETSKDERNIRKYDVKLFKPEFGGIATEKTSRLESRVLHHDLLVRLEGHLFSQGYAVDLNDALQAQESLNVQSIHGALGDVSCLRAEGWAVIEDYERIKNISAKFNPVVDFIGRCGMSNVEQSGEYQPLMKQLDDLKSAAASQADRNKRAKASKQLAVIEERVREAIKSATGLAGVPEWLISGMALFIDTFMPGRINLRIYPFESVPSFQILSNLKRDCFVDDDLENVVFAYGTRPTVKLVVLGLVTSFPGEGGETFDPMAEFEDGTEGADSEEKGFERGFRAVFTGMEGLNRFARYSRFPNVTVYPLAAYRRVRRRGAAS